MKFFNAVHQFGIIGLTLGTADYLANLREEHIHSTYRFAIVVLLHIERLDFFRIIRQDNWTLEVVFHQITFVLGSQVDPPVYGEFKLMSLRYGFFQNLDAFRIRQPNAV